MKKICLILAVIVCAAMSAGNVYAQKKVPCPNGCSNGKVTERCDYGCYNGAIRCTSCNGSGKVSQATPCSSCRGSGKTNRQEAQTCSTCRGAGSVSQTCGRCQGSGTVATAPQRLADGSYSGRGTAKCPAVGCNGGSITKTCGTCQGSRQTYRTVQDNCSSCYGSGKTNTTVTCPTCNGRTGSVCPKCNGYANIQKDCKRCNGNGYIYVSE